MKTSRTFKYIDIILCSIVFEALERPVKASRISYVCVCSISSCFPLFLRCLRDHKDLRNIVNITMLLCFPLYLKHRRDL